MNDQSLMMASETTYAPLVNPVAVVSQRFCTPYVVDLVVARKLVAVAEGGFSVTDVNGNAVFRVKGSSSSIHEHLVLNDAASNAVVSLQQKILTAHRRWQAYRGDSSGSDDLIFTAKKSSILQMHGTEIDVFLAANTKEGTCDFKVKGSWLERSCTIYAGNNTTVIAQMHKDHKAQSVVPGKDTFGITVYPNVDYALIVALVAILEETNEDTFAAKHSFSCIHT
ncbi:protein LURP-one-related 10-like [Rhodamnia argentea]|uniref:Protein LURP-one-related 10-like n=1 Tax=Rhodamnia argentea TaxID=178133 RepID=A0A8B8PUY1_9MYRT|nr:protein LURP-one-related 10-like [Rhodamnia argentea]